MAINLDNQENNCLADFSIDKLLAEIKIKKVNGPNSIHCRLFITVKGRDPRTAVVRGRPRK